MDIIKKSLRKQDNFFIPNKKTKRIVLENLGFATAVIIGTSLFGPFWHCTALACGRFARRWYGACCPQWIAIDSKINHSDISFF